MTPRLLDMPRATYAAQHRTPTAEAAARRLARRYRLPATLAALVTELAGLGPREVRR